MDAPEVGSCAQKVWFNDFSCNKAKRTEFAQMCLDTENFFENVIWTDESSVQLTRHCQTMRVKIGKERVLKPAAKHTVKVHIWAGISK